MATCILLHKQRLAYLLTQNGATTAILNALARQIAADSGREWTGSDPNAVYSDMEAAFSSPTSEVSFDWEASRHEHAGYAWFTFVEAPELRAWRCYTENLAADALGGAWLREENKFLWKGMSFVEFLGILARPHEEYRADQLRAQNIFEKDMIAFVGKLETIEKDWETLVSQHKLPALDPAHVKAARKLGECRALTTQEARLLLQAFSDDYARFGYPHPKVAEGVALAAASPVFVLGAPRSGTSILAQMLRDVFGYAGQNEGHLWTVYQWMREMLDRQDTFIQSTFPPRPDITTFQSLTADRLRRDIEKVFLNYPEELFGDSPWMDKTPSAHLINFTPQLENIFPNVRFVFMKRSGVGNVLSSQRKFPDRALVDHCRTWADCMMNFARVRGALKHAIMLDQGDLLEAPETVGLVLSAFLGYPEEKAQECVAYLGSHFPERTKVASKAVLDLASTDWDRESVEVFHATCGAAMDLYGYPSGDRYTVEVENGNQWCRVHMDPLEYGITLHPNPANEAPPSILYRAMDLRGVKALHSVAVCNKKGTGAQLRIDIEKDGAVVSQIAVKIQPALGEPLVINLPEALETGDMRLCIELLEGELEHRCNGIQLQKFERELLDENEESTNK